MLFSSEPIRSRQNRTVVELAKLTDRRTREAVKLFRFDGVKLAEEAIASVAEIPQMFLRESEAETIVAALEERTGCSLAERVGKLVCLDDGVFDRVSEEKSPEGVICVAKYIDKFQKKCYNI
ncbi:MAG: hypothetical protein II955_02025 [Clostridia bacterium]|nr:hypothetical protein [Clostridia bacterium]